MILKGLFLISGFLAAQRFLLGDVYHFLPLVPLFFATKWILKSPQQAGVFVMMALFFTSDLGGETYEVTITQLRYIVYFFAIGVLVCLMSFYLRRWAAIQMIMLLSLVLITTAVYSLEEAHAWDFAAITRDVLILFCIFVCLNSGKEGSCDLQSLYFASLGGLLGEIFNLMLFFDRATYAYMSFTSLKVFVVFPLFYRLYVDQKITFLSYALLALILLVVLAYNSKMLLLSLIVGLLLVAVVKLRHQPAFIWRALIGVLVLLILVQVTPVLYPDVSGNRIVGFFSTMLASPDFLGELKYLEPVRVQQHSLFFSRGAFEILFGDGIGAGINDTSGYLASVANETAFTEAEMRSGRYFNFHDIWIDFSVRFGLVTTAIILIYLVRRIMHPSQWALGIVFFLILVNASFSISGVLMTTLFYKIVLQRSTALVDSPLPHPHF